MHRLQPISVKLCSSAVVSLLDWLILQVIDFKELESCLISTIDQNSQLQVVEVRILNRLDKTDLNRVVDHVDSESTVLAQENSVIDTDMSRIGPTTVKTVLVRLFFLQFDKYFFLESHFAFCCRLLGLVNTRCRSILIGLCHQIFPVRIDGKLICRGISIARSIFCPTVFYLRQWVETLRRAHLCIYCVLWLIYRKLHVVILISILCDLNT